MFIYISIYIQGSYQIPNLYSLFHMEHLWKCHGLHHATGHRPLYIFDDFMCMEESNAHLQPTPLLQAEPQA